ncbi:MAG: hypothetical protein OXN90_15905 [Gemmatimonadota bacterium]|nr:hypothetical protein [Gemmatimonadota bacterium]
MPKPKSPGQTLYEAYCEHFLDVFGHKPSAWKGLSPRVKAKWEAVAQNFGTILIAAYQQRHNAVMPLFNTPPKPEEIASLTW